MLSKEQIESIIEKQGLTDYKWINPKDIIVAQWVRVKCIFGCPDYGLGTCPPNSPSVNDCERFFKEYEIGLIFRLTKLADKNAYPSDWSKEMTDKLLDIEREVFIAGYQKVFLLNQTCCCSCNNCSKNRFSCKDKIRSRPSPESFAVDVYQTVRNGIKVKLGWISFFLYLRFMEIESLLKYLLPREIFQYFDLIEIKEEGNNVLLLQLDEKSIKPSAHSDKELVSNGFDEPIRIQDFPLRDRAVYFIVRRRKWKDKKTGKIYTTQWGLTANGTSYSKEFAAFLKELLGSLPHK